VSAKITFSQAKEPRLTDSCYTVNGTRPFTQMMPKSYNVKTRKRELPLQFSDCSLKKWISST